MIILKPITPASALAFKATRLRALHDSSLAFSSTHATESRLPDAEWLKRSERWSKHDCNIGYLAFSDSDAENACGMVACYAEDEGVPRGHVIAMWVAPESRRSGVGKILIEALKSWAAARNLHGLTLMVTSVNGPAIAFYERIGFRMSGRKGPYPNDPGIEEYEMLLPLNP